MALASVFRRPIVGLDIGSSGIKAVALRNSRAGWALTGAAEAPAPVERLSDGTTASASPVDAVRQVLDGLKIRGARVATALSGQAAIVKRLALPAMTNDELAAAIPWEAEQYIPFALADVQLDYQVMNAGSDAARSTLDVLLVAAKKDRVDERASLIAKAGRRAVVLDIEAFALANAYQMNYPEQVDPLAALVHVGRSTTIVCLLEQGQLAFTRDISLGNLAHVDALRRELGVDAVTAERIQRGHIPPEVNRDQVKGLLLEASGQIVLEVRKTVDFYRTTAPVEHLSRIVVSGGAWNAEGLAELLTAEFEAPVEAFDPFRKVARSQATAGADVSGPAYAVAVGLAMRREGER
jgi:type IV pilus assembly protein PilM